MKNRPWKTMRREFRNGWRTAFIALLCLLWAALMVPGNTPAAEGKLMTEEEAATEKFLSNLEASLAQKFFHYRHRPVVRVAIFDFTDGSGNVVKGGIFWADKIARRLYSQPQFDVVSHEKTSRYLKWNNQTSVSALDAAGLRELQRRINTLDPGNGIHVLIVGEVKKGMGRSLEVRAKLVNFEFNIGELELEKNWVDLIPVSAEIPVPTEQALQEANEVVVRGEKQPSTEGRLVILANTRGHSLVETEYLTQFMKDQPFPWNKVPFVFVIGKEESTIPKQVQVALQKISLSPVEARLNSLKRQEYSFLHGKCGTNEIYFDEVIPAGPNYRLLASFMDLKNNQTYSETVEVQVHPGSTTLVILSIYVPSEKERFRTQQAPRINVFQLFGKDLEILPKG